MMLNQLMDLKDKYTTISFDIYDTLILRKTFHPYDVFNMVEELYVPKLSFDFFQERRRAEVELRNYTDPNIYEIYSALQTNTGISSQTMQKLLNAEIETERKVTIPRQSVVDLYNEVKKSKRVFLISDMHLPIGTIKNTLDDFGITGYEDLLLSNEQRTCKKQALYKIYTDKFQHVNCLHIGDNYKTDYLRPRDFGIDTFWIPSAYEIFKSQNPHFIEPSSLDERLKLGEYISREYQNPFKKYELPNG